MSVSCEHRGTEGARAAPAVVIIAILLLSVPLPAGGDGEISSTRSDLATELTFFLPVRFFQNQSEEMSVRLENSDGVRLAGRTIALFVG